MSLSINLVEEISRLRKEPEWMREKRIEAWKIFEDLPMPQWRYVDKERSELRYAEEWKYTSQYISELDLSKFVPFVESEELKVSPKEFREEKGVRSGFLMQKNSRTVNIALEDDLRDKGVIFTPLRKALIEHPEFVKKYFMELVPPSENKFMALHGALWDGGTFLYVPENVKLDLPLQSSFHVTSGKAFFNHTLIIAEPNSSITYFEDYKSNSQVQALHIEVVEIYLKKGARINFFTIQDWSNKVYNFSVRRSLLDSNSTINCIIGSFGGKLSRTNLDSLLKGSNAKSENFVIFFGRKNQHLDIITNALHSAKNTNSQTIVKGGLKDDATSVYRGKIKINREASQSDANLSERVLLLSDRARSNAIPGLEIENNEVKAGHGIAVSQVDDEQLFYLMSRGLKRVDAEKLIVQGFFEPIIQLVPINDLRLKFQNIIGDRIER
ncbi:MAG: Fe-S cluster assembly protein SufB [archaeon]|nr:Fe-S cluster assembly protein SufB [archaeon]